MRRRGLEPLRCYPLAPQRLETDRFCGFSLDRVVDWTSQNVDKRQAVDLLWSGDGQDVPAAVLRAREGVALERMIWGELDAFSYAESGEEAFEVLQ